MQFLSKLALTLKALDEVSRIATTYTDIQEALDDILKVIVHVFSVDAGSILLVKDEYLEFMSTFGPREKEIKKYRLRLGEGIAGWCAQNDTAIILPEPEAEVLLSQKIPIPQFKADIAKEIDYKVYNIICHPMSTRRKVLGVIELMNRLGKEEFIPEDLDILGCFAKIIALLLEVHRLKETQR